MKTFEQVYETLPANGWLTEEEARLLWDFAGQFSGPILEVGVYHGRSSCLLASLGRPLYCVDPFDGFDEDWGGDEIERRFRANMAGRDLSNFFLFRMRVEDWNISNVNFAYLDGDHTAEGTRRQIEVARKCKAKGIAIHDVNDSGGGLPIKEVALKMLGPWESRAGRLATWRLA